ncbi:MAG: DUF1553 domain-containing protein [Thermoguttaceae bacterium]
MKRSLVVVGILAAALAGTAEARPAVRPFENDGDPVPQGRIDELVFTRLKQLGIAPAKVCSDGVFVRRVYLDVTGTLPTAEEAEQFLKDTGPAKRRKLIDRLLEREEYADYWTMKWCDLLRVKSEFPINLWPNAVQAYHRWIRTSVKENLPYDRFVRELLTASGSNFRTPQVNFYRALQVREPQAIAQAVALTFMGVRPATWPKERWLDMAGFFSQIAYKPTIEWKEEIVLWDLEKAGTTGEARGAGPHANPLLKGEGTGTAVFPDGTPATLSPGQDPREAFADWLITPKNPWFARHIANRVWFWLLGRGIIDPADDIRPDNPPGNPELLACLEHELIASRYDLKHLVRLILNSRTYQLSHVAGSEDSRPRPAPRPQGERTDATDPRPKGVGTAEANFACYPLRRLEAEVLIDVLCQVTGTTEQYSSIIPEPYTYMPEDQRAVALADASITSPYLEKFGRSSRDTGLESDRNNRPTASQRLHQLNSSHIRRKIETGPKLQPLLRARGRDREEAVTALYLTILSRYPTEEELQTLSAYGKTGSGRGTVLRDLAWALINSAEFSYRH